jgi:alkylated DNA repair dioxygenase AlkB
VSLFDQLHADGEELLPFDGSAVLHRGAIPTAEASAALDALAPTVPTEAKLVRSPGGWVPEPRLTLWFGDPGCAYTYSGLTHEPELGHQPVIASVSLGAERRFALRHNVTRERVEVVLPHGSVLVMSGDSQHRWRHQVPKTAKPVGPRINLTFRVVDRG